MEDTFLLNDLDNCPPDPFNSWFNIISKHSEVYIVLCQANWTNSLGVILHSLDTSILGRGWQISHWSFSLFTWCSWQLYSLNKKYFSFIMRPGLNQTHHPFPRCHLLSSPFSSSGENHHIFVSAVSIIFTWHFFAAILLCFYLTSPQYHVHLLVQSYSHFHHMSYPFTPHCHSPSFPIPYHATYHHYIFHTVLLQFPLLQAVAIVHSSAMFIPDIIPSSPA